jgi:hypothetical protein
LDFDGMFLVDGPGFRRRLAVSAAHCHVSDNNISSGWKEPKKYHETVHAGRSLEPTLTRINPHADRLLAVLGIILALPCFILLWYETRHSAPLFRARFTRLLLYSYQISLIEQLLYCSFIDSSSVSVKKIQRNQ